MASLPSIEIDTTTIVLAVVLSVVLFIAFWTRYPASPVHPFVLGRQSLASRTRKHGESPVFTNSSNGGMISPLRPNKDLKTLSDIVESTQSVLNGQRGVWANGNESLKDLVSALRAGLVQKLGTSEDGAVCVFVSEPTDALLVTLALATANLKPVVIAPGSNIPTLPACRAVIYSAELKSVVDGFDTTANVKMIELNHQEPSPDVTAILDDGRSLIKNAAATEIPKADPTDVCLTVVSEGIVLPLTHTNVTSSLTSWLSVFPSSPTQSKPNAIDIALSFHHPSTPYGFGLAVLLIHGSCSIDLPRQPNDHEQLFELLPWRPRDAPTLLFLTQETADQLYRLLLTPLLRENRNMIRLARNGKLRMLREGVLSTTSFWDSLMWGQTRSQTRVMKVRLAVVDGQFTPSRLDFFRMSLGQPTIATTAHPFLLCPLSATHMYDFQFLPHPALNFGETPSSDNSHTGPPVVGIEIKLLGKEEDFARGCMRGDLVMRSSVLPAPANLPEVLLVKDDELPTLPPAPNAKTQKVKEAPTWLRTGMKAFVAPEGTVWQ